jgi:uncharacterized peroxidase-related enzyme
MTRINPLTIENASPESAEILAGVKNKVGMVPNLYGAIAHSPAALSAYLGFSQAIGESKISPALREQLALTSAGVNSCDYCSSAHTLMGKGAGVDSDELARNLTGESSDEKTQAALTFATAILDKHGFVDNSDLEAVRGAGYTQEEIVEIIAVVSINIFTNYFNHIAEVEIDFPFVSSPANAS